MISCQKGVPWAPQSPQITSITQVNYYITYNTQVIHWIYFITRVHPRLYWNFGNITNYPGKT